MKRNIQFIVCVLVVLCLNVDSAIAQTRSYEGTITVNPVRLEQLRDSLFVDMDIILNGVKVKSTRGVDLMPQLISGENMYRFPKVTLKGRDEYMVYERALSLMNAEEKADYEKPYVVERVNKTTNKTIRYHYVLPYESWMADAHLDMQRDECGCGETLLMKVEPVTDKVTLEHIPVPYAITPHLAFVKPVVEEIKQRDIQVESVLDFEVNKTNIRPEYMNNPQELAKIRTMIDDLNSDASIEVKGLDIIGYASPEGSLANNKRLSEGRAMALRDYLTSRYDFPRSLYHTIFGGENWDGLVKVLNAGNIDYKNEMLAIIDNYSLDTERKARLKQLHGGVPYQYLLKNVYPRLRVAVCRVNYNVKNFDVDEAKEVIKKRPQNLSLNEMFMVANSYPEGSSDFVDVFEVAVRMYPENSIANINAAAAALSHNDPVSAERYLSRVNAKDNSPEYNNAMGVLSLLKGEYELAEKYLKAAAASGLKVAKDNLEELEKKRANMAEIEKRMG
ncbi:DUF3868 domain-containing protein [Parabacteroides sp.]